MAVYTNISDDALISLLVSYDIGEFVACTPISEGVSNSNYLVETQSGKFIFTIYEHLVAPEDVPFFLELMKHLASQGIACPVPVADKQGAMVQVVDGKPAAFTSFLAGKATRQIRNVHCKALGKAMADLHLAAADFPMQRVNDASPSIIAQRLFHRVEDKLEELETGLRSELLEARQAIEAAWPKALPTGIIHGDLFPDNIFFLKDSCSGIIDFYFACNDFFSYDLAICLNSWCFEHGTEFNITKAKHILRQYSKVRALERAEQEALPILAAGAALRFLMTRLYDWLCPTEGALVQAKDPREYLAKLRFHLEVKSSAEYGL